MLEQYRNIGSYKFYQFYRLDYLKIKRDASLNILTDFLPDQ